MKTIKIIDLFNKIAKGEEIPKKIKYDTTEYLFRNYDYKETLGKYIDEQSSFIEKIDFYKLNDEVEIIEEEQDIEELEIEQDGNTYYIKNEYGTKCYLTKHSYLIADKVNELIKAVNELKNGSRKNI